MSSSIKNLDQRLYFAVSHGDAAECRRLLAAGACVPEEARAQTKLLISAIGSDGDKAAVLQLLLDAGCNPNAIGSYHETPFVAAAIWTRLDLMKILAAAGADIHWRSPTGANAASAALASPARGDTPERAEVCAWLEQQGVHFDPLCPNSRHMVCWAGSDPWSWPDVPALVALGIDPVELRWTPLMARIASGEATVEDIEAMPVDELEHRDGEGRTPFLLAITAGRRDLAEALVARGCDAEARGWCGRSALHLAARYDHADLIRWLAGRGANLEQTDEHDKTPLLTAAHEDSVSAARSLIALGAHVPAGSECLCPTAGMISRGMAELFLDAGMDVNNATDYGDWPLKSACGAGDPSLVEFLLQRGANPNLTSTGETALFSAVLSDSLDCVRLLLNAGADVNTRDVDDWTCLFNTGSLPMARLLIEHGADPAISLPENWSLPLEVSELFKSTRLMRQGV